ncbi:hypothetical protein BV898_15105 [Hypsibius exemplaris]|uniref:Uncharacterized protein n=1 Tax=Hypsibius exemplaris TaxID=2072580 RepID=A0A9X6NBY9_HYPEX|nr:hypothetical protein BV898_15105 [Hypsibius exemplaris]
MLWIRLVRSSRAFCEELNGFFGTIVFGVYGVDFLALVGLGTIMIFMPFTGFETLALLVYDILMIVTFMTLFLIPLPLVYEESSCVSSNVQDLIDRIGCSLTEEGQEAKINSQMFIDLILEPVFKKDVPRLYPGEEKKIILHMDSATAHVKDTVVKWLQDRKIKFITKKEWMANSHDLSPMDYGVNLIFKRRCNRHKAKNMAELVAITKRKWKKFGLEHCRNILKA